MGSRRRGYEFVAPLDAAGHIDPRLWHQYRDHCRVRRFWEGEDDQVGRLVHKPGGAEHARWVFDYDADRDDDDEAGYRFGSHALDTRRVCVDPRRGRRDAHVSGDIGAAGSVMAAPCGARPSRRRSRTDHGALSASGDPKRHSVRAMIVKGWIWKPIIARLGRLNGAFCCSCI